jgi:hypothetical protein
LASWRNARLRRSRTLAWARRRLAPVSGAVGDHLPAITRPSVWATLSAQGATSFAQAGMVSASSSVSGVTSQTWPSAVSAKSPRLNVRVQIRSSTYRSTAERTGSIKSRAIEARLLASMWTSVMARLRARKCVSACPHDRVQLGPLASSGPCLGIVTDRRGMGV